MQTDLGDVDAIEGNGSLARIREAEQRHGERRFSGTSTTQQTDLLFSFEGEGNAANDGRKIGCIANNEICDDEEGVGVGG